MTAIHWEFTEPDTDRRVLASDIFESEEIPDGPADCSTLTSSSCAFIAVCAASLLKRICSSYAFNSSPERATFLLKVTFTTFGAGSDWSSRASVPNCDKRRSQGISSN